MTETSNAPDASAAWSLLFGVRRSVRYHMRRQRFFDRLDRVGALASLVAGSSTIVTLLASVDHRLVLAAAAATALAGASAVIFTPGLRARQHNDLAREFLGLERDMVRAGDATSGRLAELTARRLEIEATEPPILRVLDAMCHNELLTALGVDEGQRARVTRLQRWLANWADFRADRLRKHPAAH